MDPRHEMARLVQQALQEFIRPVQLLTVEADDKTGEVTGRFRSGPLLFDYTISGEKVSYRPLGSPEKGEKAAGEAARPAAVDQPHEQGGPETPEPEPQKQRSDAIEDAGRDAWVRRGVQFLAGLWDRPEARVDAFLAAEVRMDAASGIKRCTTGYQCGSTCIARSKVCISESRNPERLQRIQQFVAAGAGVAGRTGAFAAPALQPDPIQPNRNPKAAAAAEKVIKQLAILEKAMTPELIELAAAVGGEMDGLAYRMKGANSFAGKIERETGSDQNYEKTAREMGDVVRYTMRFSSESYVAGVEQALAAMEARGYVARVKNFWQPNQPYRGINVAYTAPDGSLFELQFHTPESLEVKHRTRPLYSQYREEKDSPTRERLWATMVLQQNKLRSPVSPFIGRARSVMKKRLMGLGALKRFSYQAAEEAGVV